MVNYFIYGFYNLVYQILTIGFLFYANTYLNSFVIPDSLKWKDGVLREDLTGLAIAQTFVLLVEAVVLFFILSYINKKYVASNLKVDSESVLIGWTSGIYLFITIGFIAYLIYAGFK
jgi:hypothetical protein